ncbi:hypothetical protein [Agromyces sp. Marseille-Q5079]|uniref:hypothetical protein n=1 Tax=Agromyces sp. Marseille-Q5079 TaxID=3439059 RepID=UPI003D9C9941
MTNKMTRTGRMVRAGFVTEEAVYGVVLVAGMIVVAGAKDGTSWTVFTTVATTVLVFWAAHVYAGTVAHHGFEVDRFTSLQEAFGQSMHRSLGLLTSSLIPLFILLLGATELIDDQTTIWLALWTCVLVLTVLGFIAYARRGAPWIWRIIGALTTGTFGLAMILLKAVIH